jgi:hypothetical protein
MNRDHDAFIHVIETWLDLGVGREDPDAVLDRVVEHLDATPQRGAGWLARRFALKPRRSIFYGLAAAALVAAALLGANLLGRNTGAPSPTPSPSAQPLAGTTLLAPGTYFVHEQFPMRITFTVPSDRWQHYVWENGAASAYTRALCAGGPDCEPPDAAGIGFHIVTGVPADPCDPGSARADIGTTIEDLSAALADRPGWVATNPGSTQLGGFPALSFELRAEPGQIQGCSGSVRAFYAGALGRGATQGERLRLWVVDVDGTRLVVEAFDFPGTPDEDVAAATQIVESIHIEPGL